MIIPFIKNNDHPIFVYRKDGSKFELFKTFNIGGCLLVKINPMLVEVDNKQKIGVRFESELAKVTVWVPNAKKVRLHLHNKQIFIELEPVGRGYWHTETRLLKHNYLYSFELTIDDKVIERADPASLCQHNGVHGPSTAIDINLYQFNDQHWKGWALKNYIIYELHVGTFSQQGDFEGIVQKLDHLKELGITAIEMMPVGTFPGDRNWGYDGVFPFAVQQCYGGVLGLQKLVDSCHQKGIAVILDVVYNHFGPEGNYFEDFAPYFTNKYQTPWGSAINFDEAYCDGVRDFFIENALMWFRDFHIDALRLDAVHSIKDFGATHILSLLREKVNQLNLQLGKVHHLMIECDLNDSKYIDKPSLGGYGADAQWIDEFHHALRVAAGQPKTGYYADFNGVEHLAKSYGNAYVYDGIYSNERKRIFGNKPVNNPGEQFIVFSQNHDQIGNRIQGERSGLLYSESMQKLLAGAVLFSPFVPLFFMGEEWGEENPFLYFTSHKDPELIDKVRKGRAEEFKEFYLEGSSSDPQDEQTFLRSKLSWNRLKQKKHLQIFLFYKDLIALRKSNRVLSNLDRKNVIAKAYTLQNCLVVSRWSNGMKICAVMNFSKQVQEISLSMDKTWNIIMDSCWQKYGGKQQSSIKNDKHPSLVIQPESIVIIDVNNV